MQRLTGKAAVVTGSTSGIGAGIARGLAREGASVVISGRRAERGEQVVEEIRAAGGTAIFCETDVAKPEECRALIERCAGEFGRLDVLVNNAGIFPRASVQDTTPEFWDRVFDVNLKGAFFCCQAAIPRMKQSGGGSIINIGSGHVFNGSTNLMAYSVSKGALFTMTRKLAFALREDQIRANWITVGWVLTEKEIEVQAKEGRDEDSIRNHIPELPMGRITSEDDIAETCIFLASDTGIQITGTDISVSAGLSIHM